MKTTIYRINPNNAPPSIRKGKTRRQCLQILRRELKAYKGEPIPPTEGRWEHPLHRAVRMVESFEEPHNPYSQMRHLPAYAWHHWGRMLTNSRSGVHQYKLPRTGRMWERDYGEANPEQALKARDLLLAWVEEQLKSKKGKR